MKDVFIRTRKRRQSGVAMSEYLPIVGLIAVMLIGGMGSVGDVLRDQGSKMAQEMAGDDAGHRLPPSNGNGSVDFPTDTSPGSGDEEETPDTGGGSGSEPDYGEGPDSGNENGNGGGSGGDDDGKPGEQPGGGNDGSGDNSGGNEAPSDEDLIEQIQQFVEGLWDGLKTQFWGIVDLLASPIETAKNMYALAKGVVLDPQGTIKEIADQFKDDITELLTGSAYERGKVVGENISPASLAGIAKKVLSLPSVKNRPLDVGCSSFTAETLVMTPDGMRSIEELRVGDLVYSRSDINYSDNPQKITHLYNREVDHYFRILTPQSTIRTTAEHPFWVQGEGWVKAESLRNGHAIAAADGDRVIQDIAPIRETVRVYNFSVDQTQSYFAGEDLLWVHNSNSSCSIDEQRQRLFKERLDSVIEQVPANKRKRLEKMLAEPASKEKQLPTWFINKPELATAWNFLDDHDFPQLSKDLDTLESVASLLKKKALLNKAGITEVQLGKLLKSYQKGGARTEATKQVVDGLNDLVSNGTAFKNIDRLIGDLNHGGGNISVGAGWVLRGISNKRDDFRDALLEFEVPVNSGSGRIDIKVTDADDYTTFYEFKTIGKLPPGDFVKQFTRDLVNGDVSSLDQIRWHFEGKALGKRAFSNEDKQRLLAEIEKIEFQDERKVLSKLQVPNLDKAMLFKSIEQNFDGIFKII